MSNTRVLVVELTDAQIDFIGTSLDYAARNVRETDYGPTSEARTFGMRRLDEVEAMIASIRDAFREAGVGSL